MNKKIESLKKDHEEIDAQYWIIHYIAARLDPTGSATVRGFWKDDKYIILFGESMKNGYAYYGNSQIEAVMAVLRALRNDETDEGEREKTRETQEEAGEKEGEEKDS